MKNLLVFSLLFVSMTAAAAQNTVANCDSDRGFFRSVKVSYDTASKQYLAELAGYEGHVEESTVLKREATSGSTRFTLTTGNTGAKVTVAYNDELKQAAIVMSGTFGSKAKSPDIQFLSCN